MAMTIDPNAKVAGNANINTASDATDVPHPDIRGSVVRFYDSGSMAFDLEGKRYELTREGAVFVFKDKGARERVAPNEELMGKLAKQYNALLPLAPARWVEVVAKPVSAGRPVPVSEESVYEQKTANACATGMSKMEERIQGVEFELASLREDNRNLEAKYNNAMKEPSWGQAFMMILELLLRIAFPVLNLISAVVQLARILKNWDDPNFNKTQALFRFGLDVMGSLPVMGFLGEFGKSYARIGAFGNFGANLLFDKDSLDKNIIDTKGVRGGSSQFLGFESTKPNPFREGLGMAADMGGTALGAVGEALGPVGDAMGKAGKAVVNYTKDMLDFETAESRVGKSAPSSRPAAAPAAAPVSGVLGETFVL